MDTKNPFLGSAATTIIQIQVIAIKNFFKRRFYAILFMVWNVYDETPRYSAEVTFTL